MGFLILLIGAVVTLIAAWAINAFISILSGEQSGGLLNRWWDIFSNMGRSPAAYAEPLPEALTARKFAVGDRVQVQLLPPDVERSMPETQREVLRRCGRKVLRVEGIDEFGAVELHLLEDGSQSPDRAHHIFFIEAQYLESADEGIQATKA